jgi:hypothetical protein
MDIALIAHKQSGKTTVANYLEAKGTHKRLSFADPVKQDCIEMLNFMLQREEADPIITYKIIQDHKEETFRTLLQWYGTDFWRNFMGDPEHWINAYLRAFEAWGETEDIVCDDLRFPNEAEALHKAGFFLIKIERPGLESNDQHESEAFIDSIHGDTLLINDGTELQLCEAVDKIIDMFHMYLPEESRGRQRIVVPEGIEWDATYHYEDGLKTIKIETPGLEQPAILLEKHYPMLAHYATQLKEQGLDHHMLDVLRRYNPANEIIEEPGA